MIDNQDIITNSADEQGVIENEMGSAKTELQIATLTIELQDWKQRYAYLEADIDNLKKRTAREFEAIRLDATVRLVKPILDIIDAFERALTVQTVQEDQGVQLIYKSLQKYLEDIGVTEIECRGQFDPEFHEALGSLTAEGKESGFILEILQKGYLYKGAVLRHAKVMITA